MFDTDQFVADCRAARAEGDSHKAIADLIKRAVSNPAAVLKGLGEPEKGGVTKLFHSDTLTVLNVVWPAKMMIMPHNHDTWAVIGVYTGREDNIFWRQISDEDGGPEIEAAGARTLGTKDAVPLGKDIIHSVTNPLSRLTGAIHVYGADFFDADRSEWDPENLHKSPYDVDKNMALFEQANATVS